MSQSVKKIAGNLEDLAVRLETIKDLMLTADSELVSSARCAGLVAMVQEQMQDQVKQLYSCQGGD